MTDDRLTDFQDDLSALMHRHNLDWEALLDRLALLTLRQVNVIDDERVKSCLESCAAHLSHAALDWYASTK